MNNLNAILKESEFIALNVAASTAEELLQSLDQIPQPLRTRVVNQAGGFVNHNQWWAMLTPAADSAASFTAIAESAFAKKLSEAFGSVDEFKSQFTQAAVKVFGSGWVWLVASPDGQLVITSTANQETPLSHSYTRNNAFGF